MPPLLFMLYLENKKGLGEKYMRQLDMTGIRPTVIEEITTLAIKYKITKVILFGSRARGDFHRASDIDLAVEGGDLTGFTLDVKDTTSTLLDFDIVDMNNDIDEKLKKSIRTEGMMIYEKV